MCIASPAPLNFPHVHIPKDSSNIIVDLCLTGIGTECCSGLFPTEDWNRGYIFRFHGVQYSRQQAFYKRAEYQLRTIQTVDLPTKGILKCLTQLKETDIEEISIIELASTIPPLLQSIRYNEQRYRLDNILTYTNQPQLPAKNQDKFYDLLRQVWIGISNITVYKDLGPLGDSGNRIYDIWDAHYSGSIGLLEPDVRYQVDGYTFVQKRLDELVHHLAELFAKFANTIDVQR
jgi:hypothetical protein